MENINLITYKWEQGVYSLNDMIILVKYNQISPEEFFKITRYDYNVLTMKQEKENQS